jgi:hypothetical protein
VRAALCVACLFHLAAVTTSNLPRTTALGSSVHAPFDWYVGTFGLWQSWDMFTTIPHFLDLEGVLLATDSSGKETRYGPLLPGLAPYARSHRVQGTFMRMAFSDDAYSYFSKRYLAAICRAITSRTGSPPAKVSFELRALELRSLDAVRKDGRIAEPKTYRFGPAPCAP